MAMFARVPDSMWSIRWEIGWPIITLVPGIAEKAPQRREQFGAGPPGLPQAHVDLGALDALDVLVVLRAALPPRGRHHLGLRQQDLLDPAPISSDLASEVPGIVFVLSVSVPSWNSGRKADPAKASPPPRRQQQRGRPRSPRAADRAPPAATGRSDP